MNPDRLVRGALWASVPFNFAAAGLFAFPESALSRFVGFPTPVPAIYGYLLAYFVVLFGIAYAWIARQRVIYPPLVAMAAIGKAGVFALVLMLWFASEAPGLGVVLGLGDLAFAAIFAWWAWGAGSSTG